MYRTSDGDKTLVGAERDLFAFGAATTALGIWVTNGDVNSFYTGVTEFDKLKLPQRIILLGAAVEAILGKATISPFRQLDFAIAAVYANIFHELSTSFEREEVAGEPIISDMVYEAVVAAGIDVPCAHRNLEADTKDVHSWHKIMNLLRDYLIDGRDYLDSIDYENCGPEEAAKWLAYYNIPPSYYRPRLFATKTSTKTDLDVAKRVIIRMQSTLKRPELPVAVIKRDPSEYTATVAFASAEVQVETVVERTEPALL